MLQVMDLFNPDTQQLPQTKTVSWRNMPSALPGLVLPNISIDDVDGTVEGTRSICTGTKLGRATGQNPQKTKKGQTNGVRVSGNSLLSKTNKDTGKTSQNKICSELQTFTQTLQQCKKYFFEKHGEILLTSGLFVALQLSILSPPLPSSENQERQSARRKPAAQQPLD